MLILTRRISESLIVGDHEIVITVLSVKGNQVRIGVQADPTVAIDREEIYLRKQAERNHPSIPPNRQPAKRFASAFRRK